MRDEKTAAIEPMVGIEPEVQETATTAAAPTEALEPAPTEADTMATTTEISPERLAFLKSLSRLDQIEDYLTSPEAHLSMEELKYLKLWVCWKVEQRVDDSTGEVLYTKVPCDENGKIGASSGYRKRWMTYAEAETIRQALGYDGLGFVITKGMYFIDIDEDNAFARQWVEQHKGTYIERSQSGRGYHIYGLCNLARIPQEQRNSKERRQGKVNTKLDSRYYQKNPKNHMEVYIGGLTSRFAVCTFNRETATQEFANSTDALLMTLDGAMQKPQRQTGQDVQETHKDYDLDELITRMQSAKNGEKFSMLFSGDSSGYGSQSEADAALCALVAFWVGNDPETIMQVVERSGLYDEKWLRPDYQQRTIEAGVRACNGTFYQGIAKREMRPPFIVDGRSGEKVSAPLLAKYISENLDYRLVQEDARSDTSVYIYRGGVYKRYTEKQFKGVIKSYIESYNCILVQNRTINEVKELLLAEEETLNIREFNNNENVINFRNGLLYLNEMRLHPHSPDLLSTVQIPCRWMKDLIPTPEFDNYLMKLTCSKEDVQKVILQFLGVAISNIKGWRLKKAMFMVGLGDSGKSVIRNLGAEMVGEENNSGIDLAQMEARFGTSTIFQKRLVGSADMGYMTVNELRTFKTAVGGDILNAEFKGESAFQFRFDGLMWFCMNRLPRFGGDNGPWVYDRVMIVRCENRISEAEKDRMLLDKLRLEMEGIVQKAVYALQEVIANGYRFTECDSVRLEREEYSLSNNSVASFWMDCMVNVPPKVLSKRTVKKIFSYYRAWCETMHDGYQKTYEQFKDDLAAYLGVGKFDELILRKGPGMMFENWSLRPEIEKELDKMVYEDFMGAYEDAQEEIKKTEDRKAARVKAG